MGSRGRKNLADSDARNETRVSRDSRNPLKGLGTNYSALGSYPSKQSTATLIVHVLGGVWLCMLHVKFVHLTAPAYGFNFQQ